MAIDREVLLIADQLQKYFASHPDAADSVEGITQSWLVSSKQRYLLKNVQSALDYLVAQGRLTAVSTKDGKKIYKR